MVNTPNDNKDPKEVSINDHDDDAVGCLKLCRGAEHEHVGFCCREHTESFVYKIDLVRFANWLKSDRPIFTRARLEYFERQRKGVEIGELIYVDGKDLASKSRVIFENLYGVSPDSNRSWLAYYTYVELSPQYKLENLFSTPKEIKDHMTDNVNRVWEYNNKDDKPRSFPVLIHIASGEKSPEDEQSEKLYEETLEAVKEAWSTSTSSKRFKDHFEKASKTCVQIKKIVCLGLGSMRVVKDQPKRRYKPAFQHEAVFTIANLLHAKYAAEDSSTPPIEITFQDPDYRDQEMNILSLRGQENGNKVDFVDDPKGYLAIDANTLVVGVFLPFDIPYLSIIADILPQGPAGFLINKVRLDPKKKFFCSADRVTPKVTKLLLEKYDRTRFDDHPVDENIAELLENEDEYWLNHIDCFLKPKLRETLHTALDNLLLS